MIAQDGSGDEESVSGVWEDGRVLDEWLREGPGAANGLTDKERSIVHSRLRVLKYRISTRC